MDKDQKWMLMTYYCPTHGDSSLLKSIEVTRKEICEKYLKKTSNIKN